VEDIVHLYNEARVFVAPLWSGAGLQNKVLEAMSCGTPVVCTKVVNASLQAPSQAVHVAATNQEFAQQVLTLLSSEAQQKIVGQQGRDFVLANYQWNVENEKLKVLLD
jgi:glycosyltransferase involved in cell wall biosynthesis